MLVIDEKQYKGADSKVQANAAVAKWCASIMDLATGSADQGVAVMVAEFGSSSLAADGGGGGAADEPKGFNAKSRTAASFYGIDKDHKRAKKKAKSGEKKDGSTNIKVELVRESHDVSWGIVIGENASRQHLITRVVADSVADGKLKTGDVILLVEGKQADTLDHEDVMTFARSTTTKLKLSVKRPLVVTEWGDSENSDDEEEYGF